MTSIPSNRKEYTGLIFFFITCGERGGGMKRDNSPLSNKKVQWFQIDIRSSGK